MSKKKGYPRKPYSFERVLKDLADDIGYDNIETVIEKKRKAIEHISNPNFKDEENITKNLCMHIAATDPKSIYPEDLNDDLIDREKAIFNDQLSNSEKPKEIIEKIIEGKISKFFEEVCLAEQFFVMDNKVKIRQFVNNYNKKYDCDLIIKNFIIFKVGEIIA